MQSNQKKSYQIIDFNQSFRIEKPDRLFIVDTMEKHLNVYLSNIFNLMKMGFQRLETKHSHFHFVKNVMDQYEYMISMVYMYQDFKGLYQAMIRYISKQKDIMTEQIILGVLKKSYASIRFKKLKRNQTDTIELINFEPIHLFELPDTVKYFMTNKQLKPVVCDILHAKGIKVIRHSLTNQQSLENYLNEETLTYKSWNQEVDDRFQLGIKIFDESMIGKMDQSMFQMIYVETEKSYIKFNGVFNMESRCSFYEKLFKTYPDKKIIIVLPKLEILHVYHHMDEDHYLTHNNWQNCYQMYIDELDALFKYPHENIIITFSEVAHDEIYDRIRSDIAHLIKIRYGYKIHIGLNIDNEEVYDYQKLYRKYRYAIIDTYRIAHAKLNQGLDKSILIHDLSYFNQQLKNNEKDVLVVGQCIESKEVFHNFVTRGFKKFIVDPENLVEYSHIIDQYVETRGRYKKDKMYDKYDIYS